MIFSGSSTGELPEIRISFLAGLARAVGGHNTRTGAGTQTHAHRKHATDEKHPARRLGHSLSPSVLTIVMVSVYDSEET